MNLALEAHRLRQTSIRGYLGWYDVCLDRRYALERSGRGVPLAIFKFTGFKRNTFSGAACVHSAPRLSYPTLVDSKDGFYEEKGDAGYARYANVDFGKRASERRSQEGRGGATWWVERVQGEEIERRGLQGCF